MRVLIYLTLGFVLSGCNDPLTLNEVSIENDSEWLIDTNYMRSGCFSGKDCIPSLQSPSKSEINGTNLEFLDDDDLVVGVWNGSEYIAYPHPILDWHEIINETGYSISYCPLTGSAIHMKTNGEYGVSGLLYNSNLIMYDRNTGSYWPQMFLKSAAGIRQGDDTVLKTMIETTWKNWKNLFPFTKVINSKTGHSRNYSRFPYNQYKTCNSENCGDYIYFPVSKVDKRLPAKERVLSIIFQNSQKAFQISKYRQPIILNETMEGISLAVVVSGIDNIAVAFKTFENLKIDVWDLEAGNLVLSNDLGDKWNIMGRSITGNNHLLPAPAYISYWFAQAAFYPDTKIQQ